MDLNKLCAEKKKRSKCKDRSNSRYSMEDFMRLPRHDQLALAEKYWMGRTECFDDGTFQFSYTCFGNLCKQLGFRKGIVDTRSEEAAIENTNSVVYINHGKRGETVEKKFTLAKTTVDKIDQLLGDQLSNIERSKVIDALLSQVLDQRLSEKSKGKFGVAYRSVEEKRLI